MALQTCLAKFKMEISEIASKIKQSRKYKDISEELIKSAVEEYLRGNENVDEEIALKDIKAILHKAHGSFRTKDKERIALLKELEENPENSEIIDKILETNRSTKERLEIYREVYRKIFAITGKPKSILDLGCGINPVSFVYMDLENPEVKYYACDINESDRDFLEKFFQISKIQGKSEILDLGKIENVKYLPKADLCLMFKLIDVLEEEKEGHKYAEEMIKILAEKARFIVVSFATKTLSGKKMRHPYRGWIERMLDRIGLDFERFESKNEIFYVIKKI